MILADTLSHAYHRDADPKGERKFQKIIATEELPKKKRKTVAGAKRGETAKDENIQILKRFILEGWSINKKDIPEYIHQ